MIPIDRRAFLAGAGASLLAGAGRSFAQRFNQGDSVFASAFKHHDSYGVAFMDEKGTILSKHALPARGHGWAVHRASKRTVIFARRPGNFALMFNRDRELKPTLFHSRPDRHFYGHGIFSTDGKVLYATENDFEAGRGVIGLYDTTDQMNRIGELSTHGVGPHDITIMPDGKTLAVANGGIETHPAYGRAKLNLSSMKSNICFIDAGSGHLVQCHVLPSSLHHLSLRHMTGDEKGTLWIAGQYQGDPRADIALVYALDLHNGLLPIELPPPIQHVLKSYIGSIAYSADQHRLAVTSPKGGALVTFNPQTPDNPTVTMRPEVCGLSFTKKAMAASTGRGEWFVNGQQNGSGAALNWDNHISTL